MTLRHGTATVSLPSDREILITRVFDAPPELVFEAWTTPEHVKRWWSDDAAPVVVCEIDLRVGGSWRYVTRDADGTELGWHGTYREIGPPHRLVSTEVFEGFPEGAALTTATFTEQDGTTVLSITVLHTSRANRDGHVGSGMEAGMQRGFDRLDQVVERLSKRTAAHEEKGRST
jgi:uncharacterized protein YndB with AHSA1/START domain